MSKLPRKPFNGTWLIVLGWLASLVWVSHDLDLSFQTLLSGWRDMLEYFSRYAKPDFSQAPYYGKLLCETLATAFWATFIAFVLGVCLAPFAARNFTPNKFCHRISREILNALRAIPDMLLAMLFVAAIGLGPLPGVLAMGLHTAGFLGKFFAESLERIDPGVLDAISSTGASKFQLVIFAGWPSILREVFGYTLYIIDRNIRIGAVLGMVGAGGIGVALNDAIRAFNYPEAAALIIILLLTILAFDYLSTSVRGKLA